MSAVWESEARLDEWWAHLLGDSSVAQVSEFRRAYTQDFKGLFSTKLADKGLAGVDANKINPLAKECTLFNDHFSDQKLVTDIKRDVPRTFPEDPFFQTPEAQTTLERLLFRTLKLMKVPYYQGMHELMAFIYYLFRLRPEADMVLFFQTLWQSSELSDFFLPDKSSNKSRILRSCDQIYAQLQERDEDLHRHILRKLEIHPQIFLVRWLRLVFLGEFSFESCWNIWDLWITRMPSRATLLQFVVELLVVHREPLMRCTSAHQCLEYLNHLGPQLSASTWEQIESQLQIL